jgi:hypothetical protein
VDAAKNLPLIPQMNHINKLAAYLINYMGCIDSTAQTVELYSLLNEITKETLRNAIAEDDLPALAEL